MLAAAYSSCSRQSKSKKFAALCSLECTVRQSVSIGGGVLGGIGFSRFGRKVLASRRGIISWCGGRPQSWPGEISPSWIIFEQHGNRPAHLGHVRQCSVPILSRERKSRCQKPP